MKQEIFEGKDSFNEINFRLLINIKRLLLNPYKVLYLYILLFLHVWLSGSCDHYRCSNHLMRSIVSNDSSIIASFFAYNHTTDINDFLKLSEENLYCSDT
jgi:hypothetical protein